MVRNRFDSLCSLTAKLYGMGSRKLGLATHDHLHHMVLLIIL